MKRHPTVSANLAIAGLGGLLLFIWFYVPRYPFLGVGSYLPFHLLAESVSIIVSMMIFALMWNAHSLVELHGGEVAAPSEGPGKGAQFVLRLPLDVTAAPLASA